MIKSYIVRNRNNGKNLRNTLNTSLIGCVEAAKKEIEESVLTINVDFLTIEKTVVTNIGSLKTAIELLDEKYASPFDAEEKDENL
tara:strand:+ start:481 stop:735 length:255 start_codon:yes stop_codon:yes gene_type:complete